MATIKAKCPKSDNREVEVEYNLGENLEGAVALYGAETVFNLYAQKAVISVQAIIRAAAEDGKSDEEIQEIVSNHKLGARAISTGTGKTKLQKLLAEIVTATSQEERESKIKEARELLEKQSQG